MPIVPMNRQSAPKVPLDPFANVDPIYVAMATAELHREGRVFTANDDNVRLPSHPGNPKDEITVEQMLRQNKAPPSGVIYNDTGQIVDFDLGAPKAK